MPKKAVKKSVKKKTSSSKPKKSAKPKKTVKAKNSTKSNKVECKLCSETKLFAFLGVFLTLIGFIVVLLARKHDKYAMYYGKQGLVLFIAALIVSVVGGIVPFIGWFFILPVGNVLVVILWVIGLINSLSGKKKPVPWIGKFADKLEI